MSPTDSPLVPLFLKSISRKFNHIVVKKKALPVEDFLKILLFLKSGLSWDEVLFVKHQLAAQICLMYACFARFEETQSLMVDQIDFFPSCAMVTCGM